jgi:hypothetical protein
MIDISGKLLRKTCKGTKKSFDEREITIKVMENSKKRKVYCWNNQEGICKDKGRCLYLPNYF